MIINIFLFLLGLVLLLKSSDVFIKHTSIIAKKIGISDFVIGLTLVAVGTSLPELVSVIFASAKNQSEIILGSIIGSNITNIGLIGGVIGILAITKTKSNLKKRDLMIMIFATILLYIFMIDRVINLFEGASFLVLYLAYLVFLLDTKKEDKRGFENFLIFLAKFKYITVIKAKIKKAKISPERKEKRYLLINLLIIIFTGIAIFYGAKLLIEQTIFFGEFLGISKTIIGLTAIALGTSLPELGVSISAVKKGLGEIAIGNIIGSNISNILLVIGTSTLINNIFVDKLTLYYSSIFLIFITLMFWFLMKTDNKLKRKEGVILLVIYIFFLISLIIIKPIV
ncbi:calcium/sodium antiporter [archaeon]|jgi:cation:H+ antiporter|nr:calcium/sodium antiporter [archaeon]MBT4241789.1 calcium/sodium antiporter [archaeon]MBT4418337.1 calcium/sodium antiporter [archaeon]